MATIELGFSPCPNDTFIFHALIHGLVDRCGLDFSPRIADVEELNRLALGKTLPVTKMSFAAWLHLRDSYELLDSGAALGFGCGPLLVAGDASRPLDEMTIAIPGEYTTAYLLLRLWNPSLKNFVTARFDEIMPGIVNGKWHAGLIIHEGRFVYERFLLKEIVDLGAWWEKATGMPIPLGCIARLKGAIPEISNDGLAAMIRASIDYARKLPAASRDYIRSHAQEMEEAVTEQHIALYVNDFSLSLGEKGQEAVRVLIAMARDRGIVS